MKLFLYVAIHVVWVTVCLAAIGLAIIWWGWLGCPTDPSSGPFFAVPEDGCADSRTIIVLAVGLPVTACGTYWITRLRKTR
ncbi:MAG: hypothetical protein GY929_24250 [Actinomycetia bacterium]|nr:hypothetical protein [Actinomycetes bacterium]